MSTPKHSDKSKIHPENSLPKNTLNSTSINNTATTTSTNDNPLSSFLQPHTSQLAITLTILVVVILFTLYRMSTRLSQLETQMHQLLQNLQENSETPTCQNQHNMRKIVFKIGLLIETYITHMAII